MHGRKKQGLQGARKVKKTAPLACAQGYIADIRKAYERDWGSGAARERQMAVALYFIDVLALRAGHEKDEDEADTVGCCTLKARPTPPRLLGQKGSERSENTV